MEHYFESVRGGFWFQPSYRVILDSLPVTRENHWLELGVYEGRSISWLGVEVVNRQLPVTIHAVDSFQGWPGVLQGEALRAAFDAHTAPLRDALNGRFQVVAKPSPQAAEDFADASLDVIWIDADHDFGPVQADIRAWWPKLKPGGVMGGDDYLMPGVAKAVYKAFGEHHRLIPGWREESAYTGVWPSWVVRK